MSPRSLSLVLILSVVLLPVSQGFAFDDFQNPAFEKRINSIFQKSYNTVITDSEWVQMGGKVESNDYAVRSGDTLWDLSRVFFGEGAFWSKLWAVNSSITNPHLIRVGGNIRFFSGSTTQPPAVQVTAKPPEEEETPEAMVADASGDDVVAVDDEDDIPIVEEVAGQKLGGLYPGAPAIPPTKQDIVPVRQIPASFQATSVKLNKYDDGGMSFDVRPPLKMDLRYYPRSFLSSYLFRSYPHTGRVTEIEDGEAITGTNHYIYIAADKPYQVGDVVTLIGRDYRFIRLSRQGSVIAFMGEAKITDNLGSNRYRAEVFRTINPIPVGALVSEETIPSFSDDLNGRPSNLRIKVIGGSKDEEREVFGRGDVIFLEGGKSDGLEEGSVLGVYKKRSLRMDNSDEEESPKPIAHIKVFHLEDSIASAFLVQSSEAVMVGDSTGPPQFIGTESSESEQLDLEDMEMGLEDEEDV